VVQTAQTVVDHSAWKRGDRQSLVALAYSVVALVHPFLVVSEEEAHQLEMVEHSAFWEVHLEVEGEMDHSKGGQAAVVDHFPRDHY